MLRLHDSASSGNAYKVRLLLTQLGTPFERIEYDTDHGHGEDGRWQRAQVLQWLFFEQYSHEPNIATVRAWITHGVEMTPERVAALPGKRKSGEAALAVTERHLTTRRFFVGERYTIADIALYAYTHVAHEGGFDLAPYPAVRAWLGRVAAEPRHLKITD